MIDALVPSRDRPEMLARSLASLRDTAADPDSVRFLVAADDDDPATVKAADVAGARTLAFTRQGYEQLHVYYRRLAEESLFLMPRGDWLLAWNDDAVMLTPGWDAILNSLLPDVLIADIQSPHSPYLCCFPAVRREAVQMLGTYCSDNPHVDTFWQDVGRATATIAAVPVWVSHAKAGGGRPSTNGFYDAPHQAELAAAAEVIRQWRLSCPS